MRFAAIPALIAALAAPALGITITSTWTITYIQTCPYIVYKPTPTTVPAVTETVSLPYTTTSTFSQIEYSLSDYSTIFYLPTPPVVPDPNATTYTTVVDYACTTTNTNDAYTIATPSPVYVGTTTLTEWAATKTVTDVYTTATVFG